MPGLRGQLVRLAHGLEETRDQLLPLICGHTAAGRKSKADFSKRVLDLSAYEPDGYSRSDYASDIQTLVILLQGGTAFIKDPQGVFPPHGDLGKAEKYLATQVQGSFMEDAEGWPDPTEEEDVYRNEIERQLRGLKVTVQPVKGKSSPGYRVTTRPDLNDVLEQAESRLRAIEIGQY